MKVNRTTDEGMSRPSRGNRQIKPNGVGDLRYDQKARVQKEVIASSNEMSTVLCNGDDVNLHLRKDGSVKVMRLSFSKI